MSAKSECLAREYPETVTAAVSVGPIVGVSTDCYRLLIDDRQSESGRN
jgi:hypothetical protein